jgi:hypothetical protein
VTIAILVALAGGAALLAAYAGVIVFRRYRHARQHGPKGLFIELCRAHGISWRERWLLWNTARQFRLEPPAMIFLDSQQFAAAATAAAKPHERESLQRLHARLFTSR